MKVHKTIHKLVAETFIPNPNNYDTINHKDENKLNNNVENLEWCIHRYNCNYGTAITRAAISKTKVVIRIVNNKKYIYKSVVVASKHTNTYIETIRYRCRKGFLKDIGSHKIIEKWYYGTNEDKKLLMDNDYIVV